MKKRERRGEGGGKVDRVGGVGYYKQVPGEGKEVVFQLHGRSHKGPRHDVFNDKTVDF